MQKREESSNLQYRLVCKDTLTLRNIALLRKFERRIYKDAFPDEDEREDFKDLIKRIRQTDGNQPFSYCVLALEGKAVVGGVVADWYPGSCNLELIYIAIDQESRANGYGSALLWTAIGDIRKEISRSGKSIRNIYLEVEIPYRKPIGSGEINPISRLMIWEKWGARHIPISYTQPPLSEGKAPASNLMLMTLPLSKGETCRNIPAEDLKEFLKEFYAGLGAQDSTFLESMIREIDSISKDDKLIKPKELFEDEQAVKNFEDAVVTYHYQFNPKKHKAPDICYNFNSFECDLMNYSCQIHRPFKTVFIGVFRNVKIRHADHYCYTSEGKTHYMTCVNPEIHADISISVTYPERSDSAIAHMSIKPAEGSSFTDLDLIKLITPFGSRQENYQTSAPVLFYPDESEVGLTDVQLLEKFTKGTGFRMIPEGITQIAYSDGDDFFTRFIPKNGKSKIRIKDTLENKLLCGLILGIFDYKRMDAAEISDTVQPIVAKDDSFMVLCRGNLIKFEENAPEDEVIKTRLFVSPYILIPSAALALNGLVIGKSETLVDAAFNHSINPFSSKARRAETVLNNEYLEGLFQYPSEQDIVSTGRKQRNMDKRYRNLIERIDIIKAREKSSSDILIELILGILATFEILSVLNSLLDGEENLPFEAIIIIAVIIVIEIFRWIKARIS